MKRWNYVALIIVLSLIGNLVNAHALWIETAEKGRIGQQQKVRVYYGEYITGERDSVAKWYSDVKEFTLWVTGPDQKKVQLQLTPGVNYYEADFTPSAEGNYVLTISHEAKELGGTTKYHFLSSASVSVGNHVNATLAPSNILQLNTTQQESAKVNKQLSLKAYLNSTAAAGKTITVFSPSGWSRELISDANGTASFTPVWPGLYVVEVSDMDKTPGEHHGKAYTSTWKGATYSFTVAK
jgi:hypothetical protein